MNTFLDHPSMQIDFFTLITPKIDLQKSASSVFSSAGSLAGQLYQSFPTIFSRAQKKEDIASISPRRISLVNMLSSDESMISRTLDNLSYINILRLARLCKTWQKVGNQLLKKREAQLTFNFSDNHDPYKITLYIDNNYQLGNSHVTILVPVGNLQSIQNNHLTSHFKFDNFSSISSVCFAFGKTCEHIWEVKSTDWGSSPTLSQTTELENDTIFHPNFVAFFSLFTKSFKTLSVFTSTLGNEKNNLTPMYTNSRLDALNYMFKSDHLDITKLDVQNTWVRHLLTCQTKPDILSLAFRRVFEDLQDPLRDDALLNVSRVLEKLERLQNKIDIVESIITVAESELVVEPKQFRIGLPMPNEKQESPEVERMRLLAAVERRKTSLTKRIQYLKEFVDVWFTLVGSKTFLIVSGFVGNMKDDWEVYKHLNLWILPALGYKRNLD
ncbi:hypothetical protein HK096_002555 [Nowakowskiella sp. JEL0078]|nr:hypothetical protein HK096_002555 [Nowakowskiella sp. JEL0078]